MGFADSPETVDTLAGYGIRVTGYSWRWAPGLKGGTFPPHYSLNGDHAPTADSFEAYPGEDVNGDSCMCHLAPVYRTPDGRFARPDNLTPIFQPPPVTAAMTLPTIDWTPLTVFLTEWAERTQPPTALDVRIPDGAFVVNLPELSPQFTVNAPMVDVAAPNVTVTPSFAVEAATVNVPAPVIQVSVPEQAPPVVNVDVKPVVKIIREKIAKTVRFRRNNAGQIEQAEVVEE